MRRRWRRIGGGIGGRRDDLYSPNGWRSLRVCLEGEILELPKQPIMPIFTRRRIQQMLDDLIGIAAPSQFIGRLNDKRFENALPAEAELALVWAVSRLGGFESEPTWYSQHGRLPEGISTSLFPGYETVFDVKAVSDRAIPGVAGMRALTAKMVEAANKAKKGSGKRLQFFLLRTKRF